ncbi:DUF3137 domain-containing protein [Nautilia lithotrophica]
MKKRSELIIAYYKNPYLQSLEEKRKSLLFTIKIIIFVFVILYLMLIYYFKPQFDDATELLVVFVSIFLLIYYFIIKNYKKEFKEKVIHSLISLFSENFKYYPNGKIDPVKYDLSGLFLKPYDKYEGEDYVKGVLNDVDFEFSDIHTQYKTTDSKGRTHWHTIFRGTFFVSEFNKSFKGKVLVYPDFSEKLLGNLANTFQKINTHGLEFVKMDSPEFEREFKVYSDDQILARYVLSTSLMEKILKFKKAINKPLYFSFKHNMMFVAISGNDNFEAPVFKSVSDYEYVEKMISSFYFIATLVETLSLERRIWKSL